MQEFINKYVDKFILRGGDPEKRYYFVYGATYALNELIATVIMFTFAFIIGRPLEILIIFLGCINRNNNGNNHNFYICTMYSPKSPNI